MSWHQRSTGRPSSEPGLMILIPLAPCPPPHTSLQEWDELASAEHREAFLRAAISDALDTKLLPKPVV